ncbi:DUF305 domain-containing protein [Sinorhizobium medicae]|nr:DUF305 domain-containing protein [Sinorhizobium medicae]MDX0532994.1 DUF305 domain-containing protein [Sinorhizobium medicae]MDX0998840.1 DUF305 domain-containing protein [Sinorhizobium medicae]MDX1182785.1 DUF305 domain-containing protein [Sinorhizobium medicae]
MNIVSKIAVAAVAVPAALLLATTTASAQMPMPDGCKAETSGGTAMNMPGGEPSMEQMADHQKAMMEGMRQTHPAMMQGMMAKDADVSFVCGMIAHHMGAIGMSEVELKYGDDEQAKAMAQKIIDAQKKEIEEMSAWVKEHAK